MLVSWFSLVLELSWETENNNLKLKATPWGLVNFSNTLWTFQDNSKPQSIIALSMPHIRNDHMAVRARHWCGSRKLSIKIIRNLCAHEADREKCVIRFLKEWRPITDLNYRILFGRTEQEAIKYGNILLYWQISGVLNKSQLLLSLTESTGCVPSDSDQCCYRTFNLINESMVLA